MFENRWRQEKIIDLIKLALAAFLILTPWVFGLTDGMQAMFVRDYGYLARPYTPEQLLTAVDNLLSET